MVASSASKRSGHWNPSRQAPCASSQPWQYSPFPRAAASTASRKDAAVSSGSGEPSTHMAGGTHTTAASHRAQEPMKIISDYIFFFYQGL
ncbi:hypothetical protein FKM82_024405 [Ascaphus truei]